MTPVICSFCGSTDVQVKEKDLYIIDDAQMFKHCLDIPEFIKQIDLHLLAAWCK